MIDINNDEAVLEDMADALDADVDELFIDDYDFSRRVPIRQVEWGVDEFLVFANEEDAEAYALELVENNLEEEPEIFNQDWLQGYIDQNKLEKAVYDMAIEDDYAYEIAHRDPEQFWKEAERWNVADLPEEDEDGEMPSKVAEKYIEALKEEIAKERSTYPMQYLEDMFSREEALKWAMDNIGIDVDKAAKEAVSADGWEHFVAHYDGKSYTTGHGLVYVQTGGTRSKGRSAKFPKHMRPPKF